MRYKVILFAALFLAVQAVHPPRADADPLQIQSGFVYLNQDPAQSFGLDFGLFGEGFSFLAEDTESLDYFAGFSSSEPPFLLEFSGVPSPGDNTSCVGCTLSGEFLFSFTPLSSTGLLPFIMTGSLRGFTGGSIIPAIAVELAGAGRMSASEASVLFQFQEQAAPVPEPSTMLLLGTGTVLLVRRRLRTRGGPAPENP